MRPDPRHPGPERASRRPAEHMSSSSRMNLRVSAGPGTVAGTATATGAMDDVDPALQDWADEEVVARHLAEQQYLIGQQQQEQQQQQQEPPRGISSYRHLKQPLQHYPQHPQQQPKQQPKQRRQPHPQQPNNHHDADATINPIIICQCSAVFTIMIEVGHATWA